MVPPPLPIVGSIERTQSAGSASAPPAAGSAGASAGLAVGTRLGDAPSFFLSLRRGDALLPEGKRVTLAIDRPG
jgi:hypothetical protein